MKDINENWYKCEACNIWFNPKLDDYEADEDGNAFCQTCCRDRAEFKGWGVYQDYPDEWHIRPVNEPKHLHDIACHCNPKVIQENGIDIVNHNSFDGREGVEKALELLKK